MAATLFRFSFSVTALALALVGVSVAGAEPLLIGAETDGGKAVRPFHGEVEEAAVWARALFDDEVAALSRR